MTGLENDSFRQMSDSFESDESDGFTSATDESSMYEDPMVEGSKERPSDGYETSSDSHSPLPGPISNSFHSTCERLEYDSPRSPDEIPVCPIPACYIIPYDQLIQDCYACIDKPAELPMDPVIATPPRAPIFASKDDMCLLFRPVQLSPRRRTLSLDLPVRLESDGPALASAGQAAHTAGLKRRLPMEDPSDEGLRLHKAFKATYDQKATDGPSAIPKECPPPDTPVHQSGGPNEHRPFGSGWDVFSEHVHSSNSCDDIGTNFDLKSFDNEIRKSHKSFEKLSTMTEPEHTDGNGLLGVEGLEPGESDDNKRCGQADCTKSMFVIRRSSSSEANFDLAQGQECGPYSKFGMYRAHLQTDHVGTKGNDVLECNELSRMNIVSDSLISYPALFNDYGSRGKDQLIDGGPLNNDAPCPSSMGSNVVTDMSNKAILFDDYVDEVGECDDTTMDSAEAEVFRGLDSETLMHHLKDTNSPFERPCWVRSPPNTVLVKKERFPLANDPKDGHSKEDTMSDDGETADEDNKYSTDEDSRGDSCLVDPAVRESESSDVDSHLQSDLDSDSRAALLNILEGLISEKQEAGDDKPEINDMASSVFQDGVHDKVYPEEHDNGFREAQGDGYPHGDDNVCREGDSDGSHKGHSTLDDVAIADAPPVKANNSNVLQRKVRKIRRLALRALASQKFRCSECKEFFRSRELLNMHSIIHQPVGRVPSADPNKKSGYLCSLCNQTFSAGYALKKHIRVHSRERPFSCDLCGERFSQWGNLRLHWQRHMSVNPYQCPFCDKAYIAPSKLEVHVRCHTNDRPFRCDVCSANFKSNDDLRKHMMIHADYKPFSCWVCDKSFMQPSKLRSHMKDKHDIPVAVVKTDVTDEGIEYRIKICKDYKQQSAITMFDDLSTFQTIKITPVAVVKQPAQTDTKDSESVNG